MAIAGSGTDYFTTYDGNGNITGLINGLSGSTAGRYEYSPFGELLRATGPFAMLNPFRFSTKFCDGESGLVYFGYRYYNPAHGRWIGRDTARDRLPQNLYLFCQNSVLNRFDIDGQTDWALFFTGVGNFVAGSAGGIATSFGAPITLGASLFAVTGCCLEICVGLNEMVDGLESADPVSQHRESDFNMPTGLAASIGSLFGEKAQALGSFLEASGGLVKRASELPGGNLLGKIISAETVKSLSEMYGGASDVDNATQEW